MSVFHSITSRFWDTRLLKIGKAPNDPRMTLIKHLNIESTLYTLNPHPRETNFTPFRSTTSLFRGKGLSKIRYALNDPRMTLSTLNALYKLNTHPWGPNFIPFPSTTSRIRDTRLSKIGNVPNNPRKTLTTLVSKVPCIHWLLNLDPNFTPFRPTNQPFSRHNLVKQEVQGLWRSAWSLAR